MEAHPGIVFRTGAAGRRAALSGGPDVWEVVRVFANQDSPGASAVATTVNLTGLSPRMVETALRYYAAYPAEIDDWIERVDDEAARAEESWRREQELLNR